MNSLHTYCQRRQHVMIETARSNSVLLSVRICLNSAAFVHLVVVALVLLNVDMSTDNDPNVRVYTIVRWLLLTIWFNFVFLTYYPICIYCDWMERNGRWEDERARVLRKIRDVVMTSILLPTTLYCDTLFWRTWNNDRALIAPVGIFAYLPHWTHHSLHTISGVLVILDLIMVPRKRPPSILPGAIVTTIFTSVYTATVAVSYANGIVVYAVLNMFSRFQVWLLILMSYLELYFFYTLQWCLIDIVWGKKTEMKNEAKKF
ncbi:androgen-dependent TFPI-regulating protein-like [Pieris napi]|uniref:androgen-dependent TFPI-regulating protein-like n=1 Tax=Pieris napi TaxID=78633 RepID=UPI001FB99CF2|nr:androgen-dependent TFPI-regulating protein-like [Pieris napi]